MAGVTTLAVVTEDGHTIPLTGTAEHSVNGLNERFRAQARRGYLVRITGDGRGSGDLEMVEGINDPQRTFDEVKTAFASRTKSASANNFMFRGLGRSFATS